MAITIHQQPDLHSAISTPLIVTATSTNSSNDGFNFVVRFDTGVGGATIAEYKFAPNAHGAIGFNIVQMARQYIRNRNALTENNTNPPVPIHKYSNQICDREFVDNGDYAGTLLVSVVILEGYNIDGVFTIDEDSAIGVSPSPTIFNYQDFQIKDGFNPSLLDQIGHKDGDQSRIMSDRLPTTYDWPAARFVGLSQPNAIYIPARETDYGQWGVLCSSTIEGQESDAKKVRVSILPNSGAPVQEVFDLIDGETLMSHMPLWPANMNDSPIADMPKPSDYPNWKAIYFQILNDADEQVSMSYIMFNIDHPQYGECSCHGYDVVRLAWVGRRGGWEYQNFTLLSETEYETDQKVAKRVVGNYGEVQSSTDFTFNPFDESEFVTYKKINKFVTCNTDILQPNEWEFLKGLILSKQVHWVHDDGTHTPVIIQDSNFKVRNPKSKAREALTVRFKVAQDQSN